MFNPSTVKWQVHPRFQSRTPRYADEFESEGLTFRWSGAGWYIKHRHPYRCDYHDWRELFDCNVSDPVGILAVYMECGILPTNHRPEGA